MKQTPPRPTKCPSCGHVAAVTICPLCREERPAFAMLKKISQQVARAMPLCRYRARTECDCGGRGICLEAV